MTAPFVHPARIVGAFFDIETNEFVLLRADGVESREPHSPYLERLSNEYHGWFTAMNGYSGLYAATYARAVDVFAGHA